MMRRRRFLSSLALLPAAAGGVAAARAAPPVPRIATMDWTVATTLLAMGVRPEGVAQIAAYRAWVRTPRMPGSVTDIGLRAQPNLELLDRMTPDFILISRQFLSLEPVLSRIAPTRVIANDAGATKWHSMMIQTRQIAETVHRPEAAETLIAATRDAIDAHRAGLPEDARAVLVVQFMNATHVRVFGANSVYGSVLARLGLRNGWTHATNSWGFSLVSLDRLQDLDARLVVVKPIPVGSDPRQNAVWHLLPSVRRGDVVRVPPVWSFGALPAARRFAAVLVAAL